MNDQPVKYAVLRDQRLWNEDVSWVGLEPQEDGALALARIAGSADGRPIVSPVLQVIELSGLAAGPCHELFIADTDNHRIVRLDSLCNVSFVLPGAGGGGSGPGQFKSPRGLLLAHDSLYVADSGNGRIQVFRLPSLELRTIWEGAFKEPVALASDSLGRIYVLDRGLNGIQRFSPAGAADVAYNTAVALLLTGLSPISLAIDGSDTLYVSIEEAEKILRVDVSGQRLADITGDRPQHPAVLATRGERLYVADNARGEIWILDCVAGMFLGTLNDYRGPVAALALDQAGALYIKPGTDNRFHKLEERVACVPLGYLDAGPFDAGAGGVWERVHAELELPVGTRAELYLFTADSSSATPLWKYHTPALSVDTLVSSLTTPRRYLWLRVVMYSDDCRRTSPVLRQVQAETTAQSYLDHLPGVYRREDAPAGFLERWLALFRSELGDLELALDEMPRRFDPLTVSESELGWLASWLAFDPPTDVRGDELRSLLQRVHTLYERRGTPRGIGEFVELYTGLRPSIFEAFSERHVWQLGYTSSLGCNTALAAGLPDGMIVPGFTLADPRYFGLRGDYYSGIDFGSHLLTRTDPNVDFEWGKNSPDSVVPSDKFSVRWTGQITALYSEQYTFYTCTDDGVRLYLDGKLVIDKWMDQGTSEYVVDLDLAAGRTYEIKMEYYENGGGATAKLSWSSNRQVKKVIRGSFLGKYYQGTNFETLILERDDSAIDFEWGENCPHALVPANWFSVRWTGQVLPRYSERYTFHVLSDDGVRLWVNGIPIIDQWIDQSPTEHSSTIALELEAGRWYSIQLEFYEKAGIAVIRLFWSSRSQPKEIIPQKRLYSVRDETAQTELPESYGDPGAMLVGQTVVGESGPLAKSDFGMPLFSDAAHLFTVSIPAGAVPDSGHRDLLRQVIEAEKPAHTDYHLCFVEPNMRVGFQSRVGIDTIVAGPPPPMELNGAILGLDSYTGEDPAERKESRVGKKAHVGQDILVS